VARRWPLHFAPAPKNTVTSRGDHRSFAVTRLFWERCAGAASISSRRVAASFGGHRRSRHTAERMTSPSPGISKRSWLQDEEGFPGWGGASWEKRVQAVLRYGEKNPHDRARGALRLKPERAWVLAAGVRASFGPAQREMKATNQLVDATAARRRRTDFTEPCVAIIKGSQSVAASLRGAER